MLKWVKGLKGYVEIHVCFCEQPVIRHPNKLPFVVFHRYLLQLQLLYMKNSDTGDKEKVSYIYFVLIFNWIILAFNGIILLSLFYVLC